MLPLSGTAPLLVETVERLSGLIPPERMLIVTGAHLLEATRALVPWLPESNLLGEPRAASTGPALTWGTLVASSRDPGATILSLHADWFVADDARFRETARRALEAAETHDMLVTVGITPDRPDVGYGYIEVGEALDGGALRVRRFVEKPDAGRAARLIAAGALWNSGMFAWTARRFFQETEALAPEVAPHVPRLRAGDVTGFFGAVTPIAVDVSHFERSSRVAVVPGSFAWDDVGTWSALARVRPADAAGNVTVGDATAVNTNDCVVWAGDGPVVLYAVRDLVVVRANGVVLVTTRDRAASLKDLLPALPDQLRELSS
jgi:mannose-1-phosphate guanylyltransferase